MKRIFTLLFTSLILVSYTSLNGIEDIVTALKTGNSSQIAKYFDNTVEITLPSKSSSYSKSQAEVILKDFFANNGVKSFKALHKGDNGGSQFCIGTLQTNSAVYRTTIYMKQKGDKQVLQEIRFENQ